MNAILGSFVITWRETIEAALIVGILLSFLVKVGERRQFRYIYGGVALAVAGSLVFALFSNMLIDLFADVGQEILEAGILLIAVAVLTHMVIWMHHNAREIKGGLHQRAQQAIAQQRLWALALLAFVGVFREGIETVLFLSGLVLQASQSGASAGALLGAVTGVAVGIAMTWLFFRGFGHLDLRLFFRVSGVILILMAAGMLASGVGKLIALGWLPPLVEPIWNSSWLLDESRLLGSLVAGLFGYRSSPSLTQFLAYLAYFPMVWMMLRRQPQDLAR